MVNLVPVRDAVVAVLFEERVARSEAPRDVLALNVIGILEFARLR